MKKILIISDSSVGDNFIERTIQTYTNENIYYVVQGRAKEYKDANPKRYKFYEFDATSFYKIANLLKMEFVEVIVIMDNQLDTEHTIKNIRSVKKQLRIVVLNKWNLENSDPNIVLINSNEILSSRLIDYLPNVPVIAQNVGIGEGEIMEVLVPFGSSFVYRHIGVIEQKKWRIVAIYRNRELVMPNRRRMIQPNDLLVLIGEPAVLKSVFKAIKRELGQFPEPFGSNLYLYIDMNIDELSTIEEFVDRAVFITEKLEHKLYIKVVNPSDFESIWKIKSYACDDIMIDIEYDDSNLKDSFFNDIKNFHIGLVMVSNNLFRNYHSRTMLYEAHVPVFKIANKELDSVKDASIILGENRDIEKISSTIFDVSEQMSLNIELYNYLNEHQETKEQVIEHYYNLSTIFSKSIKVLKESENPIKILKQKENFMQVLPFTRKLTSRKISSLLSTDSEKLYHKLDEYHQIFIPVQI
ncbi:potassium transporter TrkA [Sulfurimonas sp.]|nr:potassium transporter TrkA [Sulfurimonas sp.]